MRCSSGCRRVRSFGGCLFAMLEFKVGGGIVLGGGFCFFLMVVACLMACFFLFFFRKDCVGEVGARMEVMQDG